MADDGPLRVRSVAVQNRKSQQNAEFCSLLAVGFRTKTEIRDMRFLFYTRTCSLLTAITLATMAIPDIGAQAASPDARTSAALPAASSFHVAPEKGYFDYRTDIPLVEQFMKKWDAKRRS